MPVRLAKGSSALACPALNVPSVAGGCSGSGPRAVLRGSSALFPPPSSLLLPFGPDPVSVAIPVPSLVRRCPGAFPCSRGATVPCELTLSTVPVLTPFPSVPGCAFSLFPSALPWMMDGGAGAEHLAGPACAQAWAGFVMCQGGSSCRAELTPGPQPGHSPEQSKQVSGTALKCQGPAAVFGFCTRAGSG